MRNKRMTISALVLGVAVICTAQARADLGFFIDASTLEFTYLKGGGGVGSIGQITIENMMSSNLVVQQLDLGADGLIGGGDDILVDLSEIGDTNQFEVAFTADVFKLGPNSYRIEGTLGIKDSQSSDAVVLGGFESRNMSIDGGFFSFGGVLANPDGLLKPGNTDTWVFQGLADDTADMINGEFGGKDGVDGTVSLETGRPAYRGGNLLDFQFVGNFDDLDEFFAGDLQGSNGADMKITLVPIPGALLLALLGVGSATALRRRLA